MKLIRNISMTIATIIILAHTVIPHQHKAQLENIIHECFFADSDEDSFANLFDKFEDIIKHVNLGEKHLENFRISNFEYNFNPIIIFQVPEVLSLLKFQLKDPEKVAHTFYYNFNYSSVENDLGCGLRAPPSI
ncbi:hypothetical protein [Apibacter sp. HY039]|uniref:hypothetical protein n=1 Tax=Apibacter sp. HY039 TaxID=2501476 RepID=UPI0013E358C3|nr:hypothetical protein [Apibacter sp. HY039]